MKILSSLFGIALFLACMVFALSNRQNVTVSLWPFDADVTMPMYLVVLGSLGTGLFFGGLFIWLGSLSHRFLARRLGKDVVVLSDKIQELEHELEQHRARMASQGTPPLLTGSKWRFWERFT